MNVHVHGIRYVAKLLIKKENRMKYYKSNRQIVIRTVILGMLLTFIGQPVLAEHFHYFVDIETTHTINPQNQLTALNVSWVYDEKMSALMKQQNPDFKALGQATINDLQKKHYFISIQFNGNPVKIGKVSHFNLQEFTQKGKTALQLDFTLPFLQPLNMTGKNELRWSFSDPSGVAIMVYYTPQNIRLGAKLQSHCKSSITENNNADHGEPAQLLALKCEL